MIDRGAWSDLLPASPSRRVLAVWALMALLNLSAGVVVASWPERQSDLDTIRRWGRSWLVEGSTIYVSDGDAPDYPPHAIVALSPLGVLPDGWAVPIWALVNLGLAPTACWLAVRAARPAARFPAAALPILMFLCWGGFRTLLQFSLLSLVLGLLAVVLADRRPNWSGVCLGLSLMKPQVAAPFFLWALFTRRLRPAVLAVAVVGGGVAVFCLRAGTSPIRLVPRYLEILQTFYVTDPIMVGLAQLRPLLAAALPSAAVADGAAAGFAGALLLAIVVFGFAEGRSRPPLTVSAPALAGVWSLLTFYHLTYGFILLLPTATLLLFRNTAPTRPLRLTMFWALQTFLMFDVPGLWRRFGSSITVAPDRVLGVAIHADRILALALLVGLVALAVRTRHLDDSEVEASQSERFQRLN